MTQIQKEVDNYINKNIDIQRAIQNEIISIRKLARLIAKEIKTSQTEAIVSAIRRYQKTNENPSSYKHALNIVKQSKISTKSDIVSLAVEKDNNLIKILPQLFKLINYNKSEVLRIIQAEESIKIIIDRSNFDKLTNLIPKDKIIHIEENLAEINLHLHQKATATSGIISVIFSELMINNINILEAMSCVPEMILFVREEELLKAYSVLFNLIKE
jgi:aspartokinase